MRSLQQLRVRPSHKKRSIHRFQLLLARCTNPRSLYSWEISTGCSTIWPSSARMAILVSLQTWCMNPG